MGKIEASEAPGINGLQPFRFPTTGSSPVLTCGSIWAVKNLAEVSVNGKALGIVWKTPYRVDATGALKPGANSMEIKVTNGWVNHIIGDRQPNVTQTYTFTSPKFYKADAPLQPSGLLGPVRILRTAEEKI